MPKGRKLIDLSGKRFGDWIVLVRVPRPLDRVCNGAYWLCQCACELKTQKVVHSRMLRSGKSTVCGLCQKSEKHKYRGRSIKYGAFYSTWSKMMGRCYTKKDNSYLHYGARGIKVSLKWHNFDNFLGWALKSEWQKGLTLERKNVNGNYNPKNCTWATAQEQASNRRRTKVEKAFGVSDTFKNLVMRFGRVSYFCAWYRYYKIGLDIETSLLRPSRADKKHG